MSEKLRDYQVLDVFCVGTFYKVKHKVTNNIFAWRAHNCSAYSDQQIQNVVKDVQIVSKVNNENIIRYYDSILHRPSKTLYFVLEYNCWRSVDELMTTCKATGKYISEVFIWHLLLELARVCKSLENLNLTVLQKCITTSSIFVDDNGNLRVNCFDLAVPNREPMCQVGIVVLALCNCTQLLDDDNAFRYSDDLRDVVRFLVEDRDCSLQPDVILYHPTVLAHSEIATGGLHVEHIIVSEQWHHSKSNLNMCDSEKAVELCKAIEPFPRMSINVLSSPIYTNVSPKATFDKEIAGLNSNRNSLSPTLAALALELPGFVPRSRRPLADSADSCCPQRVSEETLSQQWMSRLMALREREESLNKRERQLVAKEIVSSPGPQVALQHSLVDGKFTSESNGITLPPLLGQVGEERRWVSRRHQRRTSVRGRRKSYAYEELNSSLSADAGDDSMVITATKFTKETMPRRNIFPDVSSKKVHFSSSNPFVESDDSVTLTFYELDNVDSQGYQVPKSHESQTSLRDISKFKYLDGDQTPSTSLWSQSSPSKQAKVSKGVFSDITNCNFIKTPSKSSLNSKSSRVSRFSIVSDKSHKSVASIDRDSGNTGVGMGNRPYAHTPIADKKGKRRSLLPFKTPFKLKTSTKV